MSNRFHSLAAIAAVASMAAAPLAAADVRASIAPLAVVGGGFDADSVNAENHRRWRPDRVDAGDVIGGLLVIGTIAAVASAASKTTDRYRDYRYRDYRADYRRPYDSRFESRGLQNAADMCAREIERDRRVDTIDGVSRSGTGWHVTGRTRTGEAFTCTIGNDGRIEGIDFGRGGEYRGVANDRQWDDDRYLAARAAQDGPAPAYPGGPLPGESVGDPDTGS